MSEKTEKCDRFSVRVSYLCKVCGQLFKCVSTYYNHKVWHHSQHNRSIVFEESIFDLSDSEPNFETVIADEPQIIQLKDQLGVEVKQEPPDPVICILDGVKSSTNHKLTVNNAVSLLALTYGDGEPNNNSEIKTEWVEEITTNYDPYQRQNEAPVCHKNSVSVNKQLRNEDYIKNNLHLHDDNDETQSSFMDYDVDSSHGQGHCNDLDVYALKYSKITRSNGPMSTSTSTSTLLTETEHEFIKEITSDSDSSEDDVICLDDPLPLRSNKVAKTVTEPTITPTKSIFSSNLPNFLCQICSKQFTSETMLGIHVGICQLYNSAQITTITTPQSPSPTPPVALAVAVPKNSTRRRKQDIVQCDACLITVRRCHLRTHLETEHKIFGKDLGRNCVCHICGSAFPKKSSLSDHLKAHSDDRPFQCNFPNCSAAFKHKQGLKRHFEKFHVERSNLIF